MFRRKNFFAKNSFSRFLLEKTTEFRHRPQTRLTYQNEMSSILFYFRDKRLKPNTTISTWQYSN